MNSEYKKGFMEAINGVLEVLSNREKKFQDEKFEEDDSLPYELKKIENSVLGLKISFFENYYNVEEEPHLDYEGNIIRTPEEQAELQRKIRERSKQIELEFFGIKIPEEDKQTKATLENQFPECVGQAE